MDTHQQQPKVGLVLSGGTGRGNAHISVLKVMETEAIRMSRLPRLLELTDRKETILNCVLEPII